MLIFFHIAYFLETTVDRLIEDIFLYNMILWDLCNYLTCTRRSTWTLRLNDNLIINHYVYLNSDNNNNYYYYLNNNIFVFLS